MGLMKWMPLLLLAGCSSASIGTAEKLHLEKKLHLSFHFEEPTPELKVIGTYETHFKSRGKDESRARNIVNATDKLSVVIAPQQEWSFNETVGPRSEDNGFLPAPTIFAGEVLEDIGGGVCQVSSTLHAAALLSGVKIVSRQPHSRPSKYIKAGLDATVAYPPSCEQDRKGKSCYYVDLVLKNVYDFPLHVTNEISEPDSEGIRTLRMMFLGRADPVVHAEYRWQPVKTEEYKRRVRKTGRFRLASYKTIAQHGEAGVVGKSIVTLTMQDGLKTQYKYESKYPPTDEVWHVGLQFDLNGPPPWE